MEILKDQRGDSSFGAIYMILVFAIVALALVMIVKPTYQSAQKTIPKNTP
jgi:competence protein ComGC